MSPPRDIMISCDLEVDSTLDQSILKNLEKITIRVGNDEAKYTLVTNDWMGMRNDVMSGPFKSPVRILSEFEIRLKENSMPKADALNKVQVNIKRSGSNRVIGSPAIKKMENGSFTFQYCPFEIHVLSEILLIYYN